MKIGVWLLRLFHKASEAERMEFRKDLACLRANAEDLNRTIAGIKAEHLEICGADYRDRERRRQIDRRRHP